MKKQKILFSLSMFWLLSYFTTIAQNIAEFDGPVVIHKPDGISGDPSDVGLSIYRGATRLISLLGIYGDINLTAFNAFETLGGDISMGTYQNSKYVPYSSYSNAPEYGLHFSPIGTCDESVAQLGLTMLREDFPAGPLLRSADCDAGGHRISVFPELRSGSGYFSSHLGRPTNRWEIIYSNQIQNDGGVFTGSVASDYLYVNQSIYAYNLPFGDRSNLQYETSTGRFFYDNSSRRFKENISPLKDDFRKILKAQPVTYTRPGAPDRWEIGYVAEEMDKLGLDPLISHDKDGLVDNFNYEKMILYVVEVLKEQDLKINAQAELIEKLLQKNENLTQASR